MENGFIYTYIHAEVEVSKLLIKCLNMTVDFYMVQYFIQSCGSLIFGHKWRFFKFYEYYKYVPLDAKLFFWLNIIKKKKKTVRIHTMVRFKNGVRVLEVHGRPQKTIRAEIERRYEG